MLGHCPNQNDVTMSRDYDQRITAAVYSDYGFAGSWFEFSGKLVQHEVAVVALHETWRASCLDDSDRQPERAAEF